MVLLLSCCLAGCNLLLPPPAVPTLPGGAIDPQRSVELADTPFFPQRDWQCGPAALATVLAVTGVAVEPDDLASLLYVPDRRGTFQTELAALPRRHDRMAVAIDGSMDGLLRQLVLGRPVLVLQNLGLSILPRWHYAVVVGYLPASDDIVLRSGTRQRLRMDRRRFAATWRRADNWGIVVVAPDSRPDGLEAAAWLKSAAALESAGRHAAALAAFDAALVRWPDDLLALLGRANNLYGLGQLAAADAGWAEVLAREPNHPVALHNRVMVALERGDACTARALLPAITSGSAQPSLVAAARAAVAAALTGDGLSCADPR